MFQGGKDLEDGAAFAALVVVFVKIGGSTALGRFQDSPSMLTRDANNEFQIAQLGHTRRIFVLDGKA